MDRVARAWLRKMEIVYRGKGMCQNDLLCSAVKASRAWVGQGQTHVVVLARLTDASTQAKRNRVSVSQAGRQASKQAGRQAGKQKDKRAKEAYSIRRKRVPAKKKSCCLSTTAAAIAYHVHGTTAAQ